MSTQDANEQGADIEIPIIEISDGWPVDEVKTLDDCDDAFAYLTGAICAIENKIDIADEQGTNCGVPYRKLKRALRWKKAALQVVQTKRGKISRVQRQTEQRENDRVALDAVKEMFPDEFDVVLRRLGRV